MIRKIALVCGIMMLSACQVGHFTTLYNDETSIEKDGVIYQVGHTKEYVKIAIESESNLQNQIIDVQIHNRSQIIH